jgi:hypothetical protein
MAMQEQGEVYRGSKNGGSIHGGYDLSYFEIFDIWLWLVRYGSNISLVFRYPTAPEAVVR